VNEQTFGRHADFVEGNSFYWGPKWTRGHGEKRFTRNVKDPRCGVYSLIDIDVSDESTPPISTVQVNLVYIFL
jgi:hypothetical protein